MRNKTLTLTLTALLSATGCDRKGAENAVAQSATPKSEKVDKAQSAKPAKVEPPPTKPAVDENKDMPAPSDALSTPAIGEAISNFGASLYAKQIAKMDANENVVLSPMSIYLALGMTRSGAAKNTASEMNTTLELPETSSTQSVAQALAGAQRSWMQARDGVELAIANQLFADESLPLRPEFAELTRTNFGAGIQNKAFARNADRARKEINSWVEKETRTRIKDLLPPGSIDGSTQLVLVNAIWFKGNWAQPFDPKFTQKASFKTSNGKSVNVPMMSMTENLRYYEAKSEGYRALDLPYADGKTSMSFILPDEDVKLSSLEASLDFKKLGQWLDSSMPRRTEFRVPRFTIDPEASMSLSSTLQDMGMKSAFDAAKADFSPIAGDAVKLTVSDVIHKAMIIVNEEGAEAAAATGVTMYRTALVETKQFHLDRPFLFVIRDRETQAVLFVGRLVNPSK